jgi:hypothetical protein
MLAQKLKERIEPFVTATNPGAKNDPQTVAFETKMKKYAEELKWESFGVEVPNGPFSLPSADLHIYSSAFARNW